MSAKYFCAISSSFNITHYIASFDFHALWFGNRIP